jgi:enoyl-CoA hydratase
MAVDRIYARVEGEVTWLILNQPEKRNAISLDMISRGITLLKEFASEKKARVLVLAGEGEISFCAGGDISEFDQMRSNSEDALKYDKKALEFFDLLYNIEKPTVAMIHGYCLGGGLGLAASCDIRICSEDAQFAIPAARLGLGYDVEIMDRLIKLVGPSYTKEMIYTAYRYNAIDALQMGLVNKVQPKSVLEQYVIDYTINIAKNAPLSLKSAKIIASELGRLPVERNMERCKASIERCMNSKDYLNARRDFLEKRKPNFIGE